jgi:Asp-tRNA(Asn)/Glu-tRNA(Gln) amidotransferase C subunit
VTGDHAPGRSYIREAADAERITPETMRLLAALAGFAVPDEDVELLAAALSSQLRSIAALDELDLTDVNPAVEFDPRWR